MNAIHYFILYFGLLFPIYSQAKDSVSHFHFSSIEKLNDQKIGTVLLSRIYQSIDIEIKVSPMPANRAEIMASTGTLDGEVMRIWSYGVENPSIVRVPASYYQVETMPFILSHKNIEIRNKADLRNYKVGIVRGIKHTKNITSDVNTVYVSNNTENMFKHLQAGQIDVALTNTLDGKLALKKLGYNNIISMTKPIASQPLYHYIHEKHKSFIPKINQAILDFKASGQLGLLLQSTEKNALNSQ